MNNRIFWTLIPLTCLLFACSSDPATTADEAGDAGDTTGEVSFPDMGGNEDTTGTRDVSLTDAVISLTCSDEDGLTPNHTYEEAYSVPEGGMEADDLFVCPGYDDYFAIELGPGDGIVATIEFGHRIGDLDLYLLPAGTSNPDSAVEVSGTEEDIETIRYESELGGRFVLFVDGFEDAGGFYDISIKNLCHNDADCSEEQVCLLRGGYCDEVPEPECGGDSYEPNNSSSTPASLGEDTDDIDMTVVGAMCGQDVDYYRFSTRSPINLDLELRFDVGFDLDMAVLNSDGDVIAAATNQRGDREVLDMPRLAQGSYTIYIDTVAGGSTDINYNLDVRVEGTTECESDDDCSRVEGRGLCDDGGGCVSFDPDEPSEIGGACDGDEDCAGDELRCYTGGPGLDDNFCTTSCFENNDCSGLDDGQCISFGGRRGTCFAGCEATADCPVPYQCMTETNECEYVACSNDDDCEEGEACLRTEFQGLPYCREYDEDVLCDGVEEGDGNGSQSSATALDIDDLPLEGLTICDDDNDWYALEIRNGPALMEVSVEFDGDVDLDVYIHDAAGRIVGEGTTSTGNPEVAQGDYLAEGTYYIRINQFPSESGDETTAYELDARIDLIDDCEADEGDCLELLPLRILCDEETGTCGFLEGNGEVALGDPCDSNDDCDDDAEFCFTFDGAEDGNNICTRGCREGDTCADLNGDAVCTPIGRRFAACLPE
jgi:hypothetical protein